MEELLSNFVWTYQTTLIQVALSILMSIAMYCVLATGQLFLGQIGFMAIGAYTSAVLTTVFGLAPAVAILSGTIASLAISALLVEPMLRLSGVHMAIATIAFGEVVRSSLVNIGVLGGALGLSGIPLAVSPFELYVFDALLIALTCWASCSRLGRIVEATRTDELAAQSMGIDVRRVKRLSILASAAISGFAGGVSAHSLGTLSPDGFSFVASVTVLSFVALGGVASPLGAVLGAIFLTVMPELFSVLSEYRTMATGLSIVLVVLLLPAGVFPFSLLRVRGHAKR
ncbi:branched-chain amino acid ABC transporter permease [Pandoraea anhela]|uniref:Amino acid ABC transporter n=1 Tax=Pandoraea anhela TaxID=2508295 RepID=A0A5E4WET1_9BURK|nr:branched-chain amino acid ABC transporter permease [Pandoraea anhela]VVE23138.1 amino acid ABC transporter [Pandoraea anhela]